MHVALGRLSMYKGVRTPLPSPPQLFPPSLIYRGWIATILIVKEMRKIAKTTKNQQKIKSHHEGSKKQAKENYEKNKKRLQEHVPNKYRELSNEEKDIKKKYRRNR